MSTEQELLARENAAGAVSVYCMATMVVEEAARSGCKAFAASLEAALQGLLSGLTRDQQGQALRLSHALAVAGEEPAAPRLRLVYSRESDIPA